VAKPVIIRWCKKASNPLLHLVGQQCAPGVLERCLEADPVAGIRAALKFAGVLSTQDVSTAGP
jgi:hypothetical protein